MARYFFHIQDGQSYPDEEGCELSDHKAVRAEALRATGEMLRDNALGVWDGKEWEMKVVDANGELVLTLRFSADEHSAREAAA